MFVIDCETPEALHHHAQQLRQRQIPLWIVRSARGGHIYLRARGGEVENIKSGVLPDAEIRGNNQYVIGPESRHPSGAKYQWVCREGDDIPDVDLAAIDWLTDFRGQSIRLRYHSQNTRKEKRYQRTRTHIETHRKVKGNLSNSTRRYLKYGHSIPEGNRNNSLFSAACDLAGNDYPQDSALSTLVPIAEASGLEQREAIATIKSAYSREREPARPVHLQYGKDSHEWEYAQTFAANHDWIGRSANTERALFLALVEKARNNSIKGEFRASIRELSATARIGTATVQRLLKRLIDERGFIIKVGQDKTSGATLWRFTDTVIKKGRQLNLDTVTPPQWLKASVSNFNSTDACERGAIGHGGLRLYRVMISLNEPLMPKQLAERSKLRIHQVNYALKKLKEHGLVRRLKEGWLAIPLSDEDLDVQVAYPAGTLGRGWKRVRRYALERRRFASHRMFWSRLRRDKAFADAYVDFRQTLSSHDHINMTKSWLQLCRSVNPPPLPEGVDVLQYLEFLDDDLVLTALELGAVIEVE